MISLIIVSRVNESEDSLQSLNVPSIMPLQFLNLPARARAVRALSSQYIGSQTASIQSMLFSVSIS